MRTGDPKTDERDEQRRRCIASGCEHPSIPWTFHDFGNGAPCPTCGATEAISGAKRGEGHDYPMGGGADYPTIERNRMTSRPNQIEEARRLAHLLDQEATELSREEQLEVYKIVQPALARLADRLREPVSTNPPQGGGMGRIKPVETFDAGDCQPDRRERS